MDDIILKVENLSKQYRLGTVGTGTLGHDINRAWHRIRGKEDPYLQVGAVNDRGSEASSEYVWAIKDINFDVKRGEILGIIGKNGAGKSTLLKILSRVTSPTVGSIKARGRIASLLEVGTGMHPELTGLENIYLNGAILGMTKSEISSKIDEIVEFSGCQMYIDTPVKRYSSGMRVRLGFAVAAFLEPDILVVDEVLAVGDAEFQKKAIGKMQDISSSGGRTVLFVSHNMASVKKLCRNAILLENGSIKMSGSVDDVVEKYISSNRDLEELDSKINFDANFISSIQYRIIKGSQEVENGIPLFVGDEISIEISILSSCLIKDLSLAINIINTKEELVAHINNEDDDCHVNIETNQTINYTIKLFPLVMIPSTYFFDIWVGHSQSFTIGSINNAFRFDLTQGTYTKRMKKIPQHSQMVIKSKWDASKN